MTPFIIIAALITLAVLGLLIWPLKRTRNTISYERHAQNIHFAKERLQELEAQLKNATISATDYEALKLEIESTLAHDIDIANQDRAKQQDLPRRSNKYAISILCVFIPLSAIGFYMVTGTPESINPQVPERPNPEQIQELISNIEQRLEENPNDLEGWKVISRTYLALGRYDDAKKGYLRILSLGEETAETYASLADATGLKAGGEVNAEASGYAQRALELNPDNRQALWLMGLGAAQKGDKKNAREFWGRLIPLLDSVPEQQQELRDIIAQSFGEPDSSPLTSAPDANSSTNPGTNTDGGGAPGLTVSVSINSELAEQADPNDLVFIFARAKQGPPAPLAVKRVRVSQLPITVTLSDSDAMISQMKLSLFEDVTVSARVSKSGNPVAQAGDLQSDAVSSKNNERDTIELTISNIVD